VVAEVAELGPNLVLVTGGEPLMQPECQPLLTALCDAGHEVLLETGGSLDVGAVDPRVRRIVDIKCPGSGEHERNRWDNLPLLGASDEIKLVVRDRSDFDWGLGRLDAVPGETAVLWSPVHGVCDPADLVEWLLDSGARGRLQLQLHKLVWPDADRGV
jgi:7-carboxy-7-deazaguanine synthase